MAVLELRNVTLAFGGPLLLDGVDFEIEAGERVALLGRNGEGKSTLLRLVDGQLAPDDGEVRWASRGGSRAVGTRAALLAQQVPHELSGEVFDVVADGLGELGETLAEYHHLSARLAEPGDHEKILRQLEDVQHALEAAGGWQIRNRVETVLSRLSLPEEARIETLSGGLKRRVLLARALVAEPDLLMLDEPTNHLDIPSITGLEEILLEHPGAILFVTHDRSFLKRLATRIIELDRGVLRSYPGDYARYLQRKEEELASEEASRDRFDKKLAQEEVWIRQGLKARRTRNMGRVRALEKLRRERQERRERGGTATMRLEDAERSGKRVIQAKGVSFAYPNGGENEGQSGGEPVVRDFSTRILRGDKVGIIGPNGSGKSTLLKLLLGELKPDEGRVEHGTRLEIAYFDQLRAALDDDQSVADNVAEGAERITFQGKPRHVISYLESFLFPPSRARSPVSSLSGGERNRLLLAKLFTRPFNLLVLDEPTNDLDIETLELLEDLLVEFEGTLLLVSHDRAFLDNVVTSTLVLEGGGRVEDYVGGYEDYLRQRPADEAQKPAKKAQAAAKKEPPRPKARKIGYKEKIELAELPERIESLETEQAELHQRLADPDFYRSAGAEVAGVKERLESLEGELAAAYERWEALEALAG